MVETQYAVAELLLHGVSTVSFVLCYDMHSIFLIKG